MKIGSFYVTRHSNLSEVHSVFHLVCDDTLLLNDINSRHAVILGVRNILKACFKYDIVTLTIPLLLTLEMTEVSWLTVSFCNNIIYIAAIHTTKSSAGISLSQKMWSRRCRKFLINLFHNQWVGHGPSYYNYSILARIESLGQYPSSRGRHLHRWRQVRQKTALSISYLLPIFIDEGWWQPRLLKFHYHIK